MSKTLPKLDETMAEWERELLAELDEGPWIEKNVIQRLHGAERTFPALRPMLMLAPDGRIVYPVRASETNVVPSFSAELSSCGLSAFKCPRYLVCVFRRFRRGNARVTTSAGRFRGADAASGPKARRRGRRRPDPRVHHPRPHLRRRRHR